MLINFHIVNDHHLVSAVPIVYVEGLRLHPHVPCLGGVQHEGNVVEFMVLGHPVKSKNGSTISDLSEEGLEYNSWHLCALRWGMEDESDGLDGSRYIPRSEILTRPTRLSHNSRNFPYHICILANPDPLPVQKYICTWPQM